MTIGKSADQRASTVQRDPRWAAVLRRDATADGSFVFSVRTTGVYCRPSCSSRRARPENVEFHATQRAAEAAGFRPCKRCVPNGASPDRRLEQRIEKACRIIQSSPTMLPLATLARRVNMSEYHFHRVFKRITGLTPRAFGQAQRSQRVRSELRNRGTVTRAIVESGFNSNGRFYEGANQVLGMTPTRYRAGGEDVDIRFAVGECSLGSILVARSDVGVCAILLGDDPERLVRELQDRFSKASLIGGDRDFEKLVARVVGLVEAPSTAHALPLDVRGTAFQQRVWQALQRIPAGETASYSQIAERIGAPDSARAVAQACAANTIAIAIPCHRVVRSDGELSGYRWGVERKRTLLGREQRPPA